ncbi:hypothetical protein TWF694_010990 [Orbilia ellipsospora]|uniref:Uncharacterized protein n=1 Tax=Orbilia ellipsospora TaxID=2528407 RepID=A0AAV9X8U8_9PEZI
MPNPRSTTLHPTPPTDSDLQELKQSSYLLSYLQKSDVFTTANPETSTTSNEPTDLPPIPPSLLDFTRNLAAARVPKTNPVFRSGESSLSSSISEHNAEYKIHSGEYRRGSNDNDGDDTMADEGKENENENENVNEWDEDLEEVEECGYYSDEDGSAESEFDPDELTNLPYKSPAVYQLPGSGNGNKFRTLVRDGPLGSVQGENQRFVVIGKRSFRGAGLWPRKLVGVDVDLEMGEEFDSDEDDGDEEEAGLEGEVEVMWSDDGEEFWLVRDPVEGGGIGRETSWVSKDWFARRRRALSRSVTRYDEREKVELRVTMEED